MIHKGIVIGALILLFFQSMQGQYIFPEDHSYIFFKKYLDSIGETDSGKNALLYQDTILTWVRNTDTLEIYEFGEKGFHSMIYGYYIYRGDTVIYNCYRWDCFFNQIYKLYTQFKGTAALYILKGYIEVWIRRATKLNIITSE
jgi:hypothetical protein